MRCLASFSRILASITVLALTTGQHIALSADVNILLVIADDLGSDVAPGVMYEGTNKPPMPNVAAMQANGVTFTNVWASALCSPTRATILTGRYGFRTGVQYVAVPGNTIGVSTSQPSIPRALKSQLNISSAAFGKWHLARLDAAAPDPAPDHPILMGFSRYGGNLMAQVNNYNSWAKYLNNTTLAERLTTSTTYATRDVINEAVSWINRMGNQNWFCWVAFNSPHSPFHKPPNDLHSYDGLPATGAANRSYYEAMAEATDTEFGRLLSSIPSSIRAKTLVIFLGDNGTPADVKSGGLRGAKFGVYQGGIRVPMVVSGALVTSPNRTVSDLINSTDIFATVMDVHGINLSAVNEGLQQDTVSFLPYLTQVAPPATRTTVFSDIRSSGMANANFSRTVRDSRYKLLRFTISGATSEEFYDLQVDPLEATNILLRALNATEQAALDSLRARLAQLSN